jgi:hypothetical protein
VWWIVGALVVVPLLLLALVVAGLRRRLAELDRVAALAQERAEHAQRGLPASVARLQATLAQLQRRSTAVQARLAVARARKGD